MARRNNQLNTLREALEELLELDDVSGRFNDIEMRLDDIESKLIDLDKDES